MTEENKKQEPYRQHSAMLLIKYQNQYPKIWIILYEIKFYQKKLIPKNQRKPKVIPKNPGIAQKGTQKSGSKPKKVPKIMANPRITAYARYAPLTLPPEVDTPIK